MVKSLEFILIATASGLYVKFCFALVKSYSISPVRSQCFAKNFVPAFLRCLLITCLITLGLEK